MIDFAFVGMPAGVVVLQGVRVFTSLIQEKQKKQARRKASEDQTSNPGIPDIVKNRQIQIDDFV